MLCYHKDNVSAKEGIIILYFDEMKSVFGLYLEADISTHSTQFVRARMRQDQSAQSHISRSNWPELCWYLPVLYLLGNVP